MYYSKNDGSVTKNEELWNARSKVCQEMYTGRTVKFTLIIENGYLNIYHDTSYTLHYPCYSNADISFLHPPYKIAITSMNGMINNELFTDSIQIEKFTLFNTIKDNAAKYFNKELLEEPKVSDEMINAKCSDLVANFDSSKLRNKKDVINEINKKLDANILLLAEMKNIINSSKVAFKDKNFINFNNEIKAYKEKFVDIKDNIKRFENKLTQLSTIDEDTIQELFKDFDFDLVNKKLAKVQEEWEITKAKETLGNTLDNLITDNIETVIKSLNTYDEELAILSLGINEFNNEKRRLKKEENENDTFFYKGIILLLFTVNNKFNF